MSSPGKCLLPYTSTTLPSAVILGKYSVISTLTISLTLAFFKSFSLINTNSLIFESILLTIAFCLNLDTGPIITRVLRLIILTTFPSYLPRLSK